MTSPIKQKKDKLIGYRLAGLTFLFLLSKKFFFLSLGCLFLSKELGVSCKIKIKICRIIAADIYVTTSERKCRCFDVCIDHSLQQLALGLFLCGGFSQLWIFSVFWCSPPVCQSGTSYELVVPCLLLFPLCPVFNGVQDLQVWWSLMVTLIPLCALFVRQGFLL